MKRLGYAALIMFCFHSFSEQAPEPRRSRSRRISYYREAPVLNPPPEIIEKMNDPEEPFNGYRMKHSIGLEGGLPLGLGVGTGNTTILSQPAVSFGVWTSRTSGWEFYFGTQKDLDSGTITTSVNNPISTAPPPLTKTVTTTYSSVVANPRSFILGAAYKHRIYQVKHFGLSADFLATVVPKYSSQYIGSGTVTTTTGNINSPGDYQVVENFTNKDVSFSTALGFGPRFNIEYNFPYLPHLLIGFSTGVFVKFGGEKTDISTTTNQTTTYSSGDPGTPATTGNHGDTSTVVTGSGGSGSTYGIGGTGLNISGSGLIPVSVVGTFRIRYAF